MILKRMQIVQSINACMLAESVKIQLLGKGGKEAGHCVMILTVTSREIVNG